MSHVFTTNFSYELPLGPGRTFGQNLRGPAGIVLTGWQLSGIFTVTTGTPFSVASDPTLTHPLIQNGSRADLIAGGNNNPVLGGPDRYFDPSQFTIQKRGFYGNLGRNTVIGPGLAMLDFSMKKNTKLTETKNLQFRAEFFNIPNRANFGLPATTAFDSSARPIASVGRITNTVTSSRQIQFALRFEF